MVKPSYSIHYCYVYYCYQMPNGPHLFNSADMEPAATMVMVVGAASQLRFGKEKGLSSGVCGGHMGVNLCKS